jgi:CD2 antigen cytoplasmic tail-binding protein 2
LRAVENLNFKILDLEYLVVAEGKMELPTVPSQRKRVRFSYSDEDSDAEEAPRAKKVRFPKGKKDSQRDAVPIKNLGVIDGEEEEDGAILSTDPRVAALERATRRDVGYDLLAEDTSVPLPDDVAVAEEVYEDEDEGERIEDDGTKIEPFNLKQEREEGYFDAEGNYVEYRNEDDTKDAWLDSVEVDTRFAGKASGKSVEDAEEDAGISEKEIAAIKRRISESLQPGESVLRALRRLKDKAKEEGGRNGRMTGETKVVFDQLTEDAMRLLDNGDYNIYEEKKETLQREAEGYEALARMRAGETNGAQTSTSEAASDMFSDDVERPAASTSNGLGFSSGAEANGSSGGMDMFGDEEDNSDKNSSVAADGANPLEGTGYVYDEASGYYYNSELGYYYDQNSGLYCSASTHKWYKFDGDTNAYTEVTQ